jgi:glyoxylase-like metal-dependent hydrolase (beta-lactamase superfamily II)
MCQHSRRGFLKSLIAAPAAGILDQAFVRAALARAQAPAASADLFDIEKAAGHTWIALARPAAMLNCNAVIYEGRAGLIVVDTHSKPSAAAALAAQLKREVSAKPVRSIINTHFHYDHSQGNPAYLAHTPRPTFISSAKTRQLLEEEGARRVAASVEMMRGRVESAKKALAAAKSTEERQRWERQIPEMEAFIREMQGYEPVLADVTFENHLVLHTGNDELHLTFRGRAHTASDICVYSERTRSLATGDLVVGFIPGMGDGFPYEWTATLDSLDKLPFGSVLPGHGPVQKGRSRFGEFRSYVEEMTSAVAREKKAGKSVAQVQQAVTPATLKSLADNGWGGYVVEATRRYRGLSSGRDAVQSVADGVKANVADAYRAAP